MIFTSLHYILFLLPLVVGLFWGNPKRYRIWVIAIASAAFYASWNPAYLPLLLLVTAMSWGFGVLFTKNKQATSLFSSYAVCSAFAIIFFRIATGLSKISTSFFGHRSKPLFQVWKKSLVCKNGYYPLASLFFSFKLSRMS